jgi:prevent-host-death family protein
MRRRYSIAEASANLAAIIDQAEAGQEIEITRRGAPVAAFISVRELARLRGGKASFGAAYRSFLDKHALDEVGLDEDFAASLREKGAGRSVSL